MAYPTPEHQRFAEEIVRFTDATVRRIALISLSLFYDGSSPDMHESGQSVCDDILQDARKATKDALDTLGGIPAQIELGDETVNVLIKGWAGPKSQSLTHSHWYITRGREVGICTVQTAQLLADIQAADFAKN